MLAQETDRSHSQIQGLDGMQSRRLLASMLGTSVQENGVAESMMPTRCLDEVGRRISNIVGSDGGFFCG